MLKTALASFVTALALLILVVAPSASAAPVATSPTSTTLAVPAQVVLRVPTTLTASVTQAGGPVATGAVRFQRQSASGWVTLGDAAVDGSGVARIGASFDSTPVSLRATYLGGEGLDPSESAPVVVDASPQPTTVSLRAPRSVVDERTLTVSASVRTPYGVVPGVTVTFQVLRDRAWRTYETATTDGAGVARVTSKPRRSYVYRAVVSAGGWYTAAASSTTKVTNKPPGTVVTLPRRAPRPQRPLPAQARATTAGADATVSGIGASVWRSMTGRSWRSGCPVGRSQLRLVKVTYWGFDGYRHRGELVVHRSIAGKTARAFTDLYRHKVSIRSMYRVDRFGYSSSVMGANDLASMRADNTSAFNCRDVVGRPGVRSPHAYGRAIDINPFENPYRYRYGRWTPNSWWRNHAAGTYAWTKKSHLVPTIMRRNGFRWTFGSIDGQHFDG